MAKRAQILMMLKAAFPPKNENQVKKKVYASLAFCA